ncbi:MAG: hypothetical protein WA940_03435, partial [Sphingopyxis sp.]
RLNGADRAERQSRRDYKGFQALHKDSAARCLLLSRCLNPPLRSAGHASRQPFGGLNLAGAIDPLAACLKHL